MTKLRSIDKVYSLLYCHCFANDFWCVAFAAKRAILPSMTNDQVVLHRRVAFDWNGNAPCPIYIFDSAITDTF